MSTEIQTPTKPTMQDILATMFSDSEVDSADTTNILKAAILCLVDAINADYDPELHELIHKVFAVPDTYKNKIDLFTIWNSALAFKGSCVYNYNRSTLSRERYAERCRLIELCFKSLGIKATVVMIDRLSKNLSENLPKEEMIVINHSKDRVDCLPDNLWVASDTELDDIYDYFYHYIHQKSNGIIEKSRATRDVITLLTSQER